MNYELLSRIYGTVEALFWLPLLKPGVGFGLAGWRKCYSTRGLPFGADRSTVEHLRKLTAAGLLVTAGATQGKSWRLTPLGVLTAECNLGLDSAGPRELFKRICKLEAESSITFPMSAKKLCMGWDLIPSAGVWLEKANRSKATWKAYQSRLARLSVTLAPLLILGYVDLLTDHDGRLWGLTVTDAGRNAQWPDVPATGADKEACFQAYETGYSAGVLYVHKTPPAEYSNTISLMLPASGWE